MNFHELTDRISCILFPARCVLCGEVVGYGDYWCGRCPCPLCETDEAPNNNIVSAMRYADAVRPAVWRIKKKPDKHILRFFAFQMEAAARKKWPDMSFDVLVPVPISADKRKERGFNQAERLAWELGQLIHTPVEEQALMRTNATLVQHDLSKSKRLDNAQASYQILNGDIVKGKQILLVDDVITTGATILACMYCLMAAGAAGVHAITAVRTPPKQNQYRAEPL